MAHLVWWCASLLSHANRLWVMAASASLLMIATLLHIPRSQPSRLSSLHKPKMVSSLLLCVNTMHVRPCKKLVVRSLFLAAFPQGTLAPTLTHLN